MQLRKHSRHVDAVHPAPLGCNTSGHCWSLFMNCNGETLPAVASAILLLGFQHPAHVHASPLPQAQEMAAAKGVSLPEDFAAAAAAGGLRRSVLEVYARLASSGFLTAWLVKAVPAFRDRLIRDRLFFFKVWAEVAIDSGEQGGRECLLPAFDLMPLHKWAVGPFYPMLACREQLVQVLNLKPKSGNEPGPPHRLPAGCATVAELRKRGDEFWSEFEFYLSDLLVRPRFVVLRREQGGPGPPRQAPPRVCCRHAAHKAV